MKVVLNHLEIYPQSYDRINENISTLIGKNSDNPPSGHFQRVSGDRSIPTKVNINIYILTKLDPRWHYFLDNMFSLYFPYKTKFFTSYLF